MTRPPPAATSLAILSAGPPGTGTRVGVVGLLEPGELAAGTWCRAPTDAKRHPAGAPRLAPHGLRHQEHASRAQAPSTVRSTDPVPCGTGPTAATAARLGRRATASDMRSRAKRCARPASRPDYSSAPASHMPPAGFYNRVVLEHTSERPKPRRREATLPPRAECRDPCGARTAELSQARGRMTVSGADTHRDDRSSPWIYPGPLRLGYLMSPMGARGELEFALRGRPCGNGLRRNQPVSGRTSKLARSFRAAPLAPSRKGTRAAAPEVPSTHGTPSLRKEQRPVHRASTEGRLARRLFYQPRRLR